jgi:hypothetical protein
MINFFDGNTPGFRSSSVMLTQVLPSLIVIRILPLKTICYALQSRMNWHVYCVVAAFCGQRWQIHR